MCVCSLTLNAKRPSKRSTAIKQESERDGESERDREADEQEHEK